MNTGTLIAQVIAIAGDHVVIRVETAHGPVMGICQVPSLQGDLPGKWMSVLSGKPVMLTGYQHDGILTAEILVDGVPLAVLRAAADHAYVPSSEYPWPGWSLRTGKDWTETLHDVVGNIVAVIIVGTLFVMILVRNANTQTRPVSWLRSLFTGFMGVGADSLSSRVVRPSKIAETKTESKAP